MRQEEAQAQVPHSYTTARTLLSILRLSQALARLRFSDYVCQVRHGPHSMPDLCCTERTCTWCCMELLFPSLILTPLSYSSDFRLEPAQVGKRNG